MQSDNPLRHLPFATAYIDPSGCVRFVNQAAALLFGADAERLEGSAFVELFDPAHRASLLDRFQRALSGASQEFCSVLLTGSACEFSLTPFPADEEALPGVLCVLQTTPRRPVLDAMRESMLLLDGDATVLDINRAGLEMFGAGQREDLVGRSVFTRIPEEQRDSFRSVHRTVMDGAAEATLEFALPGPQGTGRTFHSTVRALHSDTGSVIATLWMARDVTLLAHEKRHDAFLVRLDDAIRPLSDPAEITDSAVRLLCEHLKADRCSYAEIRTDSDQIDVLGNYSAHLPSIVGRYSTPSFGPQFFSRMSAGKPQVFRNARLELDSNAAGAYAAMNIAAIVAVPILKHGRLVAGLGVHQAAPRDWRHDEVELVRKVANRCWESIERGRVERALRASEEQFRTLADTIPNLAWMAHSDGYIFWYSRRWYDYTGTSPSQMEGWGWQAVHHAPDLPRVMEEWNRSIRTGSPFEMVFPLKSAAGEFRPFLTRVEPIKDSAGRVLRWFGTNTDITVQQEAERSEKQLRQAAELLNRMAPLLLTELDDEVVARRITEFASQAVDAEFGALVRSAAEPDQPSVVIYSAPGFSGDLRHMECSIPSLAVFEGNAVLRSLDGSEGSGSYLAVPIHSRAGGILGALIFGHTEPGRFSGQAESLATGIGALAAIALDNALLFQQARRSGEALRRMNEDLGRVNEDLKQFAYSASHDLREPLRMVSLYSQFLDREAKDKLTGNESRYLDYIRKGALRLDSLISDLLSYTQSTEKPAGATLCADSNECVRQAIANLSAAIAETQARIDYAKLPPVRAAAVHLTLVFQNLIGNALKYRSREIPEIRIRSARQGGHCLFSVADNGIGIGEEYSRQIFGIFKRLHTQDEYSGTGIGLAICQRIVQRAGGRIWVESNPGAGATFFFTLPTAEDA